MNQQYIVTPSGNAVNVDRITQFHVEVRTPDGYATKAERPVSVEVRACVDGGTDGSGAWVTLFRGANAPALSKWANAVLAPEDVDHIDAIRSDLGREYSHAGARIMVAVMRKLQDRVAPIVMWYHLLPDGWEVKFGEDMEP